jgi:hypothetical protein
MRHVLTSYATAVGERVDAAGGPEEMLVAYLRGTLTYMRDHPAHVRVLVEGLVRDPDLGPGSTAQASRRQSVAGILEQGQAAGAFRAFDPRVLALMINGALDGVVAAWIGAPDLDLDTAAAELETAVLLAVRSPGRRETSV